jgi:NADPH:quinone reductase-like Zn-dependent oxidoreductase
MKAILIKEKGGAENLVLRDYQTPPSREGSVLIQVRAFGINHAEIYMRRGDWGDSGTGLVPGGKGRRDVSRCAGDLEIPLTGAGDDHPSLF